MTKKETKRNVSPQVSRWWLVGGALMVVVMWYIMGLIQQTGKP